VTENSHPAEFLSGKWTVDSGGYFHRGHCIPFGTKPCYVNSYTAILDCILCPLYNRNDAAFAGFFYATYLLVGPLSEEGCDV
jgi:hypothetical protein